MANMANTANQHLGGYGSTDRLTIQTVDIRTPYLPPNAFDLCLDQEARLVSRIQALGGFAQVCPIPGKHPRQYKEQPWVHPPGNARRISQRGGMAAGDMVEGVTYDLVTYNVPVGWEGIIISLMNVFSPSSSGPGFVEDSGDLAWRLALDHLYYAPNYGNILTSLGSLGNMYPLEGAGIRIYSNQTISYQVAAVNPGNLDPNGRVLVRWEGYIYPIR